MERKDFKFHLHYIWHMLTHYSDHPMEHYAWLFNFLYRVFPPGWHTDGPQLLQGDKMLKNLTWQLPSVSTNPQRVNCRRLPSLVLQWNSILRLLQLNVYTLTYLFVVCLGLHLVCPWICTYMSWCCNNTRLATYRKPKCDVHIKVMRYFLLARN